MKGVISLQPLTRKCARSTSNIFYCPLKSSVICTNSLYFITADLTDNSFPEKLFYQRERHDIVLNDLGNNTGTDLDKHTISLKTRAYNDNLEE